MSRVAGVNSLWLLGIGAIGILALAGKGVTQGIENMGPSDNVYDSLFQKYGTRYRVPWRWLKAIAIQESDLGQDPRVVNHEWSSDGLSRGLMQITMATFKALTNKYGLNFKLTPDELDDPENSIQLAAILVAELISSFGVNDRESVIRAYNGGPNFGPSTDAYYAHFLINIARVMSENPGDELEGYS